MKRIHYSWLMLIVSCLCVFSAGSQMNSQSVFLLSIRETFNLSTAAATSVMMFPHTIGVISGPICARLFSRFGIKKILLLLMLFQSISLTFFTFTESIITTIIGSLFFGMVFGSMTTIFPAVVVKKWFKDRGNFAMTIMITCSTLGGMLYAPIASRLIEYRGYHFGYGTLLAYIMCILFPLILIVVKDDPSDVNTFAYEDKAKENKPINKNTQLLGEGVTSLQALRTTTFYMVLVYCLFMEFGGYMDQHIVNMTVSIGYSRITGGSIASVCYVGGVCSRLYLSTLNDKIGVKNTTLLSCCLCIITSFMLIYFSDVNLYLYSVICFLFGAAIKAGKVEASSMCYKLYGASDDYSKIYSNICLVHGLLVNAISTAVGASFDATGSYNTILFICVLLSLICIVLSRLLIKDDKKHDINN